MCDKKIGEVFGFTVLEDKYSGPDQEINRQGTCPTIHYPTTSD
jgi:hypothetical protein